MPQDWKSLVSGKFKKDLAWTFLGLGVMSLSGVLLNIAIAVFYRPADLGVFNQAYAIYMFAAQLAVVGIPVSVLRQIPERARERETCGAILLSAFLLTAAGGTLVTGVLWFSREGLAVLLSSTPLGLSLAWIAPGLIFFCLNKVAFSAFNGYRRMKLLAVLQGFRSFLLTAVLLALALARWPGQRLTVVFPVTEFIIFVMSLFFIGSRASRPVVSDVKHWLKRHLQFGAKSSISLVLQQLNPRVDILMLGYFSGDALVGLYSFAAMMADGFYQLAMVINRNVTPLLVREIASKQFSRLRDFIKKGKTMSLRFMVPLGVFLVLAYRPFLKIIGKTDQYQQGWGVFAILVLGIVAASAYLPFRALLLAADMPGWHSIMVSILVGTNIILNALLIPVWGMTGAAAATATAMASLVFWLKMIARWKLRTGEQKPAPLI